MNKKDNEIGKVYQTKDYGKFKTMVGNRDVEPSRVAKIRSSIERVGFRMCPIVVNSKFEVIDGQGRLAALMDLGLPVSYVVDEDADVSVCRSLNINQANWRTIDYIKSYASSGDSRDYVSLLRFCNDYDKLPLFVKLSCCSGLGTVCSRGRAISAYVMSGDFKFLYPERDRAEEFEFLMRFEDAFDCVRGSSEYYYQATLWVVRNLDIDKSRLVNKVLDLRERLAGAVDLKTCLESLSEIYNDRIRGDRVYFDHEYKVRVTDATGRDYSK